MMFYKAKVFVKNQVDNLFNSPNTSSQASLFSFETVGTTTEVANNTKLDDNIILIIKIEIEEKYYQNNDVALDSLLNILNPNDVALDGLLATMISDKEIKKQPIQKNRITKLNSSYENFKPGRKTNRPTRQSVVTVLQK